MLPTEAERRANQEGYEAYMRGISESKNPYDRSTNEHLSWNDGWMEAQALEED